MRKQRIPDEEDPEYYGELLFQDSDEFLEKCRKANQRTANLFLIPFTIFLGLFITVIPGFILFLVITGRIHGQEDFTKAITVCLTPFLFGGGIIAYFWIGSRLGSTNKKWEPASIHSHGFFLPEGSFVWYKKIKSFKVSKYTNPRRADDRYRFITIKMKSGTEVIVYDVPTLNYHGAIEHFDELIKLLEWNVKGKVLRKR